MWLDTRWTGGNPTSISFWDSQMKDLNSLSHQDPFICLFPMPSNDRGEVAGFGVTNSGEIYGFLASPCGLDGTATSCCETGSHYVGRWRIRHHAHRGALSNLIGQPG
jgi:hypothetical protein